jgi:type IV pilus assembly protein PilA
MNKLKKMGQQGFTIVELLIVIVIIGILAALVFVQFNNMQARARDAERKADIRLIESKLAEYNADEGEYPAGDEATAIATTLAPIDGIPADALEDPGTTTYTYESDGASYTLSATLERPGDGETNPYTRTGGND